MSESALHDLADLLSPRELDEYLRKHGGKRLRLCNPKRLRRTSRNAEIQAGWRTGATYGELAREYHLTERMVRYIIHGRPARICEPIKPTVHELEPTL